MDCHLIRAVRALRDASSHNSSDFVNILGFPHERDSSSGRRFRESRAQNLVQVLESPVCALRRMARCAIACFAGSEAKPLWVARQNKLLIAP